MAECSMDQVSDTVSTWTIAGKEWKLHRLRMRDRAQAVQWLRDKRRNNILTRCGVPVPDNLRALALAELESRPINIGELFGDDESEAYLLYLSARREQPGLTPEKAMDAFDAIDRQTRVAMLYFLCEVLTPKDGDANPQVSSSPSSPSEP